MNLLFRAVPRDCWAAAWHSATAVVGGIAIALAVLGILRATEPLGAWLLSVASGGAS